MRDTDSWAQAFGKNVEDIPAPPTRRPRRELSSVPEPDDAASGRDTAAGEDAPVPAAEPTEGEEAGAVRRLFPGDDIDAALAAARPGAVEAPGVPGGRGRAPDVVGRAEVDPGGPPVEGSAVGAPRRKAGSGRPSRRRPPARPPVEPGQRLTPAELRARRAARAAEQRVAAALATEGVTAAVESARVTGGAVEVVVGCPDEVVDDVLDAVLGEFGERGVEVELGDGWVRVWLAQADSEPAKQRAVWVPAQLRERVRSYTEETGESVSQLVLRAFNTYHDQLESMFDDEDLPVGPLQISTAKRRHDVETPVQLWMYWRRSHEAEIDTAVRASGAGSRSALLTELLARYLDELGR